MTRLSKFLASSLLGLLLAPPIFGASHFKVLYDFGATREGGVYPGGPPLLLNGNLYGTTYSGGDTGACEGYGCGTVFELTLADGKIVEEIIYEFHDNGDGANPDCCLASDLTGNLYGTSRGAGVGASPIFELSPSAGGWNFQAIYQPGGSPGLTVNRSGNIFGVIGGGVNNGAGALGELSPFDGVWNYAALYSFCSQPHCADGEPPYNPVSIDSKGNLYGTVYNGGEYGYGLAYELGRDPTDVLSAVWKYHVMHSFGAYPGDAGRSLAGLVPDGRGNAFGAGYNGGPNGYGVIYELKPSLENPWMWDEVQLYGFSADLAQGGFPTGAMVMDKKGNLYGTNGGGPATCPGGVSCGMVYELSPTKSGPWTYTILHIFNGTDGFVPNGLAIDEKGNLFGTTNEGGAYDDGVVFEITP